jgi:hypothetical protein
LGQEYVISFGNFLCDDIDIISFYQARKKLGEACSLPLEWEI